MRIIASVTILLCALVAPVSRRAKIRCIVIAALFYVRYRTDPAQGIGNNLGGLAASP